MALKNPRPIGPDGIGTLPDGQFTSVSEHINRTGLAYLGKRTGGDGSVTLTYTNRRGEPRSLNASEWLKKYNDIYFNPIGHRPPPAATTRTGPVKVPHQPASVTGRSASGVRLWILAGICVLIGLGLFYSGYLTAIE
ncbi:hypothetical protein GCM10010168_79420 [Actinoplanes ianthinogenes]|uniref:Uncharacterized protein n=1 Tax=Actinoplanes ianthinogenes TaxID=122358 RepID=A0ABM7LKC6_9ACTN|nr:hypothetical protein [Actinoplanes ianthinogenes]BCJ39603.1 hypothetical protein Aiant_02600 [Actinoplanes ianthinogenes]GGR48606.1 hypothetical protein GCM10010168_79420 [Actinoplanes ianthinogenes]